MCVFGIYCTQTCVCKEGDVFGLKYVTTMCVCGTRKCGTICVFGIYCTQTCGSKDGDMFGYTILPKKMWYHMYLWNYPDVRLHNCTRKCGTICMCVGCTRKYGTIWVLGKYSCRHMCLQEGCMCGCLVTALQKFNPRVSAAWRGVAAP